MDAHSEAYHAKPFGVDPSFGGRSAPLFRRSTQTVSSKAAQHSRSWRRLRILTRSLLSQKGETLVTTS